MVGGAPVTTHARHDSSSETREHILPSQTPSGLCPVCCVVIPCGVNGYVPLCCAVMLDDVPVCCDGLSVSPYTVCCDGVL